VVAVAHGEEAVGAEGEVFEGEFAEIVGLGDIERRGDRWIGLPACAQLIGPELHSFGLPIAEDLSGEGAAVERVTGREGQGERGGDGDIAQIACAGAHGDDIGALGEQAAGDDDLKLFAVPFEAGFFRRLRGDKDRLFAASVFYGLIEVEEDPAVEGDPGGIGPRRCGHDARRHSVDWTARRRALACAGGRQEQDQDRQQSDDRMTGSLGFIHASRPCKKWDGYLK